MVNVENFFKNDSPCGTFFFLIQICFENNPTLDWGKENSKLVITLKTEEQRMNSFGLKVIHKEM